MPEEDGSGESGGAGILPESRTSWPAFARRERQKKPANPVGMTG